MAFGQSLEAPLEATVANGGSAVFQFFRPESFPASWHCVPGAGATVTIDVSVKRDAALDAADDWFAHQTHPSITGSSADLEEGPFHLLRFSSSGGTAVVRVLSQDCRQRV